MLEELLQMLHDYNPYVKTFTCLFELFKESDSVKNYNLAIHTDKKPSKEHFRDTMDLFHPRLQLLYLGRKMILSDRMIIALRHRAKINKIGFENLSRIVISLRSYDVLAYPLLFRLGEDGWKLKMSQK